MKPTIHVVSLEGVKIVSPDLDTCGFFARSVEDLQLIADVYNCKQHDGAGPEAMPKVLKFAFVKTAFGRKQAQVPLQRWRRL
jgi:Asp-tRNA(Asn)/Glu-tRNA(Gln) amidotransferase A subunit family amidase